MAKFINPQADWAFKYIFGSEDNKECLITILNGVFEGEFIIKDVKFLQTEQIRHRKEERGVVFDVMCLTNDGRRIIVEMQKKEQEYFVDRALFYSAKAIVEQAKQGEWDFHLAPVYTICFMNFVAEEGIPIQFRTDIGLGLLKEEALRSRRKRPSKKKNWKLSDLKYGFEKMRVIFFQLPLFEKREPECMSILDCWIYIIRNMEHLKEIPFLEKYPVFRKLAEIGDLRKLTPEEREFYEEDIKIMRDLYATDKWEKKKRRRDLEKATAEAKAKGLAEGRAQGLEEGRTAGRAEGRAEGRVEGKAEGKAEGKTEGKLEVAKRMVLGGIPDTQIIQFTGLTLEQINKLKN